MPSGFDGIYWQPLQLSLAGGLQQRADDRVRPSIYLDICRDAQFDEIGGIQTRLPYGPAKGAIFGGGTIANARRIVAYGDELVLFTADSLYSWNEQLSAWVFRSTHLAVAVNETPRFVTTADQIDGDRAELSGTVFFAWQEFGTTVYVAAHDKKTGGVLMQPTAVPGAAGRPRLVALNTRVLLFVDNALGSLVARSIDPAAPTSGVASAGSAVVSGSFATYFDVVKVNGQDLVAGVCRRSPTTSYSVFTVTSALVVNAVAKARTADGPLAIASTPSGTNLQVVRANGTALQGDYLTTSTLADVTTSQALGTASGTPVNQIAACYRSLATGGAFRCYVFWSAEESGITSTKVAAYNYVDTLGAIGTQANLVRQLGVASRAFDYNGSTFVWLTFAGITTFNGTNEFAVPAFATQNTYFLYRDDGLLVAKAVATHGGGFAPSIGRLPGVVLTGGTTAFSWCATERRRVVLEGDKRGFAARAPVDVTFEFDSNRARRCARLGRTLYISGGEVLQYDGVRTVECGHHIYPWVFSMIDAAGGGAVAPGTYAYKITWRHQNAQGETDRSTTATIGQVTVSGNSVSFPLPFAPLTVTHKTAVAPAVEVWRTPIAAQADSDYFLVTSADPSVTTGANRYIPNDPTLASLPTFNDFLADATLTTREANPENGAVLENLSPPAASIIFATDTRLFLLGVAGDPDRGWYSKLRGSNEVAAFHDTLTFDVPRDGGEITAGWFDENGQLFVARTSAIYAFVGVGKDNLGQGQNYAFSRIVSSDIGAVSQEAVALTPRGVLLKSRKGWHLINGNGGLQYVGAAVSDFDGEEVLAINVVEKQHQVRVLTAARMIVWDYLVDQWGEWTIANGLHACMYQGAHVYLTAAGTRTQLTTYSGVDYGLDVETAWIKPANTVADAQNDRAVGAQGDGRVRKLQPLGEHRGAHLLRMRVAYNYVSSYIDDKAWNPSPATIGGPLQMVHGPKRPRCQAFKVRLTAVSAGTAAYLATYGDGLEDVETSSSFGVWSAVITARTPGALGNGMTLSIGFELGTSGVDVRDDARWLHASQSWITAPNNVGIKVTFDPAGAPLTVGELEAAINAASQLCSVTVPDPLGGALNSSAMRAKVEVAAGFNSGAFGVPASESLKLTGLGLEVGLEQGLFRRLTPAQRQ